ncbi:MAG: NB-ARC domain-containing protein [Caldilineaceae bacterium]
MAYVPEFADLINRALARLDRSPSWLAQRIDVNPSTVSRWLNQGARPGDPEIVVRVADTLGLTAQVQELLTAAGYGYVAVDPQAEPESTPAPTQTTPLESDRPIHTNLPAAVTPFLGREGELAELTRLLADPKLRLLSIIGPGGMGKTRLAVECARRETAKYPDGIYFVPLAPLQAVEDLVPAIAAAVGFFFLTDARTPHQQLFDYLREKRLLLVLDNFEHLIDGAGLVHELLQTAPRLKALVTSRERLRLSGETVFLLDGMDFPDWETSADLNKHSAVGLFLQSARFARPDFTLNSDELPYVVRLCRLVDGVPLGIVLAAAWVEMLSLQEITGEIERSLDFLSSDLRDLPERQRSLRAVFDHSWRLLGDNERSVFRQMAIFRGGFTRQAAEEVIGAGLPLLTALLNKSLIQRTETGRYELHELVRQYAAEKLILDPASPALHERHARYYLALLHRQMDDLSGRQLQSRQGNVSADLDNIRAGWEWAAESREVMLIGSALEDLCRFYEWQGRYAEGVAASRLSVSVARSVGKGRIEANGLIWQAAFCRTLGEQAEARSLLQDSASILQQLAQTGVDVRREQATLVFGLARLARDAGDGSSAKQRFTEAVALFEALDDPWSVARALGELSYVLRNLENVGETAQSQQHYLEAEQAARRSVAICRQNSYSVGVAEGLIQLSASLNSGLDEAQQVSEESLALYTQLKITSGVLAAQCQISVNKLARGEYAEARLINQQVLKVAEPSGNLSLTGRAYLHLGMVELASRAYAQAQRFLQLSVTACRAAGVRPFLALALSYLGYAERGMGNSVAAAQHLAEALRLGLEIQSLWPLSASIDLWVLLLADEGKWEKVLEFHSFVLPSAPRRHWSKDIVVLHPDAAADHLSPEVIAAAKSRGASRTLVATVHEILDEIAKYPEN